MLEVDVKADRASVLRLLVLSKPLNGYLQMWRHKLDSRSWVAQRTAEVLERGAAAVPGGFVDVEEVCFTCIVSFREKTAFRLYHRRSSVGLRESVT